MGPILICDKSTLQSLSPLESNYLRRYFHLNVPPVLLAEILGDLKKEADGSSTEKVIQWARKIVPSCSVVNMDFRDIIRGELAGHPMPHRGRPILPPGKHVVYEDGKRGVIHEKSPGEEALLRWQDGKFHDSEQLLAAAWRHTLKSINLEVIQTKLRRFYSSRLRLRTLTEAADFADDLIASADTGPLLLWFLLDVGFHPDEAAASIELISKRSNFAFATALPYTHQCVRASLLFHFALAFGLITTRASNRVDLEYLFYAPFCNAFSSGDKLHRDLAPHLLNENQTFIGRDELKADFASIRSYFDGLSEPNRSREFDLPGPPERSDSVTLQVWKKVMRVDYRNSPRLSKEASPEVLDTILQHCRTMLSSGNPSSTSYQGHTDDLEFVAIRHEVKKNGPCFCGSDKTFGTCCGRNL